MPLKDKLEKVQGEEKSTISTQSEIPLYPVNINKYVETISESVVGEVTFEFPLLNEQTDIHDKETEYVASKESDAIKTEDMKRPQSDKEATDQAAKLFEERQKKFLYGRIVSGNIFDDAGNLLAAKGTVIDEHIISIIKVKNKLVELIMNNTK